MSICIRRRKFLAAVATAAAAAWPLAGGAQRPQMPVIGLLQLGAPSSWDFTGFRQGLKEAGYVEGQNLAIEVRWANYDPDRLPELAADLVHRRVRVIVAIASSLAVRAAKAATDTIPIVFGLGNDPVQQGFVASLNRPGGNITGMTSLSTALVGKQLGMLHELLPQASHFGFLSDPSIASHELVVKDAQAAASAIGRTIEVLAPLAAARSMRSLHAPRMKSTSRGCWSTTVRFSSLHAFNWPSWQLGLQPPQSTRFASRSKPAGF
jgi:putative ABC transport system substrate-binding protein